MSTQERHPEPDPRQSHRDNPDGTPPGEDLSGLHQQSQAFLAAGSQILNQALSGNSQAFLAANRQHGGQ